MGSYRYSSFFKLFKHWFHRCRDFDWKLAAALRRVHWTDYWYMNFVLLYRVTILPFFRRFVLAFRTAIIVQQKKLEIRCKEIIYTWNPRTYKQTYSWFLPIQCSEFDNDSFSVSDTGIPYCVKFRDVLISRITPGSPPPSVTVPASVFVSYCEILCQCCEIFPISPGSRPL